MRMTSECPTLKFCEDRECAERKRRLPYRQNEHDSAERKDENRVRVYGVVRQRRRVLAQLVKDKDYEKLSVINHLFQELCEDYEFYSGEDEASSVLGALFRCFEKFTGSENEWENYVDLGDEKRKEMLAAAYRQFMLNQVTEAVKSSLEGYKQDNLPWRE